MIQIKRETASLQLTRRHLLRIGAGSGLAATAVLAGCSPKTTANQATARKTLPLPNVIPGKKLPGSRQPASRYGLPAYTQYPRNPTKSVNETPGSGGTVSTLQVLWGSPPPPLKQNRWLQELNKRLGVQLNQTFATTTDYSNKITTTIASGNIPDLTHVVVDAAAGVMQPILQGAFTDLTNLLKGGGIAKYPNLARIPIDAWRNSAINNTIYGVPFPSPPANTIAMYRSDWAQELGFTTMPQNADEVGQLLIAFSKRSPRKGKVTWGIGGIGDATWLANYMFRVPNNWELKRDGTLVNMIETDEMESALAYLNKLWKAGAFNPDAVAISSQKTTNDNLFVSSQTGFHTESPGGWYSAGDFIDQLHQADPRAEIKPLVPPGHDGGHGRLAIFNGYYGAIMIPSNVGKDSKRVDELLKILNYWYSPFGSEEYRFFIYGIEGYQYKLDSHGNPVPTGNSKAASELYGNYLLRADGRVLFYPEHVNGALQAQQAMDGTLHDVSVDPTQGLISKTANTANASLQQLNSDYQNGIITGRQPMSDIKKWRKEWAAQGGAKIRNEYSAALDKKSGGNHVQK